MITSIQLASVAGSGAQAIRDSVTVPSGISAAGDRVAFQTTAGNLVAGGTNGYGHVFVKDMASGAIVHASTGTSGAQANYFSSLGSISADGLHVAFSSGATNLTGGHTNGLWDVFVKDLATGVLVNASTSAKGALANWYSSGGSLSADGHLVAFESYSTNLVANDVTWTSKIFVKDLATGAVVNASTTAAGVQANGESHDARLSADGHSVAYSSIATNLAPGDANGTMDVFVKSLDTGAVVLASSAADGTAANGASGAASITADGRFVAFESAATNLVAGDTNGVADIFVKDVRTGVIVDVSVNEAGVQANGASSGAAISGDGRFVVFQSTASNLVAGDNNGIADIFVKDLATGHVERMSTDAKGHEVNGLFAGASISGDGSHVSFYSNASNLVAGDANGSYDVFVATEAVAPLNKAPVIETTHLSLAENTTDAGTVLAVDPDADSVTYAITGGADAAHLAIDARTGAVSFRSAPDFEAPADADHDNAYAIEVTASDGKGGVATHALVVSVDDVAAVDVALGGKDDIINGSSEADHLRGREGNDIIIGGSGDDVVSGGKGDDLVVAGYGHQTLSGNSGFDTLDFSGLAGDLTVSTGSHKATVTGGPGVADTWFSGFEAIVGNGGNGHYSGSRGAEQFSIVGDGDNWFRGKGGADVFSGGGGHDTYEFQKKDVASGGVAEITNFEVGHDHLALSYFLKGNHIKGATYEQVLSLVDVARPDGGHDTMIRGLIAGHMTDIVKLDGLAASALTVHDLVLASAGDPPALPGRQ